eukprot:Blabericola_migrator_1__9451@NODE_5119_length_869_cov_3_150873_g3249_i0_p1_GENE_NODE_5119_length_869_cov_3_150873_g3249_i0NODE_5119_length_869_cov_3_150873_g3249_i0_p1_ORF_typecomplete_len145_score16_00ATPsynt_DE_N/PF02823_16/4_2e23ATPsynt_DE/PF00401_20/1_5e10_NODE_5119_length_869_cov_3_150873_g3249_i032466
MTEDCFHLEIVSAEGAIFSGSVRRLQITGVMGELGVYPGHSPLLTGVCPGLIRFTKKNGEQEVLYLSGGFLEVQPKVTTVLADTAVRGVDLDQEKALATRKEVEECLRGRSHGDVNYAQATAELAKAIAQLRVIRLSKESRDQT